MPILKKGVRDKATGNQAGFSLVEVLLSALLFSCLIVVMLTFLNFTAGYWQAQEQVDEVQASVQTGLDRMAREIRQAASLHISGDHQISFYDSNDRLVEYFLMAGTLYRRREGAVKQPVASNIAELEFSYGSKGLVRIKLTGTGGISYTTAVRVRVMQ